MYEYIKGIFLGLNKDYIVIENNGIGYKIYTSGSTIAQMPKINNEVKVYIKQIVKEDSINLYGFLTKEELEMFELLLTINGVGAKAGLSLLSISEVSSLKLAIFNADEKILTKAPGIGVKTAKRIILELKDKISIDELTGVSDDIEVIIKSNSNYNEAYEALISLGYSPKESEKALKNVNVEDSIENVIKYCLKYLMN